jgi:hypothetical protein
MGEVPIMSRIPLIIPLVFSLSIFSNMNYLYANCGSCGVSARNDSGGGDAAGAAGAAMGLMFGLLTASSEQEEAEAEEEEEQMDRLAEELAVAFETVDPTKKLHYHEEEGHEHHKHENHELPSP